MSESVKVTSNKMRIAFAALGLRICLLAGLLQVLAPAWAFASAVRMLADPLSDVAICQSHTGHPGQAPAPQSHHCALCPPCHHAGSSQVVLPVVVIELHPPDGYAPARYSIRLATPPRGPPSPNPRARAPPVFT
jgi:hypothetical protein